MKNNTCICVTENMDNIDDTEKYMLQKINSVRHGEISLTNPSSNLLYGWSEKYIYMSQNDTQMFRLIVTATLYHLDEPYTVYLDGKNVGVLKRQQNGYHKLVLDSTNIDLFYMKNIKVLQGETTVLEGSFV
jgi:hypothetical protein